MMDCKKKNKVTRKKRDKQELKRQSRRENNLSFMSPTLTNNYGLTEVR